MNKEERLRALLAKWREFAKECQEVIDEPDDDHEHGWARGRQMLANKCADELEAVLADPTPTRDPETCWHIFLAKQVGPLDGGPAKSTRYRCQECGTFLVGAPYVVEVTIGPRLPGERK